MSLRAEPIAARIVKLLGDFVARSRRGIVVGGDAAIVRAAGNLRIPSVAYYPVGESPSPDIVPGLAADVLALRNTPAELSDKLKDYFFAGVWLVWFVDPRARTVEVYTAPDQVTTLTEADTLTGGDVLPGFVLPVVQVFAAGVPGASP